MEVSEKPKLIYVGDPMCSWCYGIANELDAVKDRYEGHLEFEIIMGGLRPYNTQTMTELKDFLSHHWQDVNKMSGQKFNYGILDSTEITYDTEPPSRATVIIRDIAPELTFEFFQLTQEAFYLENKNMHLVSSYTSALKELNIDQGEFERAFHSEKYKTAIKKDFELSGEIGVRSFPTLLLFDGKTYHVIAQGFATQDEMIDRIDKLI